MDVLTQIHRLGRYPYLPYMLFLVALIVVLASCTGQNQSHRWFGYLLAGSLVVISMLIIRI